jgi:hypothetical protein
LIPLSQTSNHFDDQGNAHMVDVSDKATTARAATASASVLMAPETAQTIQAEADFMAKYRFFAHVGPTIGRYEGVGWGRCDKPCTCKPNAKGLKVTGDAFAKTKDGVTIRVTSWR